jgi:hypothetical protein
MSVQELATGFRRLCGCGCNRPVSRTTEWRHKNRVRPESPPSPWRRRIAHFQAESPPIITPDKQRRSRTDKISSSSRSRVDASDHPHLHADTVTTLPTLEDVRRAEKTILRGEYFYFFACNFFYLNPFFLFSSDCCDEAEARSCSRGSSRWLQHGTRSGGTPEKSGEHSSGDVS